ncbi:hypothetical protein HW555_001240, partial [Spodoptera exigua]
NYHPCLLVGCSVNNSKFPFINFVDNLKILKRPIEVIGELNNLTQNVSKRHCLNEVADIKNIARLTANGCSLKYAFFNASAAVTLCIRSYVKSSCSKDKPQSERSWWSIFFRNPASGYSSNVISLTRVVPRKRGFKVINSANIHPTLHMLIGNEYSFDSRSSPGARYQSVTTPGVYGQRENSNSNSRAIPRSATFRKPSRVKRMLFVSSCDIRHFSCCAEKILLLLRNVSMDIFHYQEYLLAFGAQRYRVSCDNVRVPQSNHFPRLLVGCSVNSECPSINSIDKFKIFKRPIKVIGKLSNRGMYPILISTSSSLSKAPTEELVWELKSSPESELEYSSSSSDSSDIKNISRSTTSGYSLKYACFNASAAVTFFIGSYAKSSCSKDKPQTESNSGSIILRNPPGGYSSNFISTSASLSKAPSEELVWELNSSPVSEPEYSSSSSDSSDVKNISRLTANGCSLKYACFNASAAVTLSIGS